MRTLSLCLIIGCITWGCAPTATQQNENDVAGDLTLCTAPRPQLCTREYRPVCAQLEDGSWKMYATGCTACSDAEVVGYRDAACAPD